MTNRRLTVRGIIFKNGKIFGQQLTPDYQGQARDYWCTPGGGLEDGESIHECLDREMIEETGIKPKIGKLLFIQQFIRKDSIEELEFFFHIENADEYENIDLSKTTHGLIETTCAEFIDTKTHNILPAFLQTIDIQDYIDHNQPVFFVSSLGEKAATL